MCETISKRIKKIRQELFDGSSTKFAKTLGVSSNTITNWISGTRNISGGVTSKILFNLPEISSNWLLTGEGEMLNTNNDIKEDKEYQSLTPKENMNNKPYQNEIISSNDLLLTLKEIAEANKINAQANDKRADAEKVRADSEKITSESMKEMILILKELKDEFITKKGDNQQDSQEHDDAVRSVS